ncbi:hypothetical protein [Streptococcus ruminantium]|uniref:hypothetical protein n=1 Tax=Streptococcus ruminantium TaxID=1917441 RepID=UPI0012DDC467|nr:hypothetical protein [Streptococcus ruminantium]
MEDLGVKKMEVTLLRLDDGQELFINNTVGINDIIARCKKYDLKYSSIERSHHVNIGDLQNSPNSILVNLENILDDSKRIYAHNTGKKYIFIDDFNKLLELKFEKIRNILFLGSASTFTTAIINLISKFIHRISLADRKIFWSILPLESDIDYFDYTLKRISYSKLKNLKSITINRLVDESITLDGNYIETMKVDDLMKTLQDEKDNFCYIGHTRSELAWINGGIIGGNSDNAQYYDHNLDVIKISEINSRDIFIFGCFSNKLADLAISNPQSLSTSAINGKALTYSGYSSYCYADETLFMYYNSLYLEDYSQYEIIKKIDEVSKVNGIDDLAEMFLIGDPTFNFEKNDELNLIKQWDPKQERQISISLQEGHSVFSILLDSDIRESVQNELSILISGYTTTKQPLFGVLRKEYEKLYLDLFTNGYFNRGSVFLKVTEIPMDNSYNRLNNILLEMSTGIFFSKRLFDRAQTLLFEIKQARIKNKKNINKISKNINIYKKMGKKLDEISYLEAEYFDEIKKKALRQKINFEEEIFENLDFRIENEDGKILNCPYCTRQLFKRKITDSYSKKLIRKQLFCPKCAIIQDTPSCAPDNIFITIESKECLKNGEKVSGEIEIIGTGVAINSIKHHVYILRGEENNILLSSGEISEKNSGKIKIPFDITVSKGTNKYLYFIKVLLLIDNRLYIAKKDIKIV